MQVYLPDDLYREVKDRGLPASELLQRAVREEVRRAELLAEVDKYVDELTVEVGEPTPEERARANALFARMDARRAKRAG
jgi:hypothetical protein